MENRRPPNHRSFGRRPRPASFGSGADQDRVFTRREPAGGARRGSDAAVGRRRRTGPTGDGPQGAGGRDWYRDRSSDGHGRPRRRGERPDRSHGAAKGRSRRPWQTGDLVKITSDLQITDGKFLGRMINALPFADARTTDRRLRDALFKLLARRVRAARILDICTGSGIIGFEAMSRGAMSVTFVERSTRACSIIKQNLELCSVRSGRCEISPLEALAFLARVKRQRRFWDVVYFGPPYETDYTEYLKHFGNGVSIRPGGILAIEHSSGNELPDSIGLLTKRKVLVEGDAAISVFERK